uniref:ZP domain-containing protein n=1 Tax=Ditylenchus dipsaci TaxID=166011 RepID=A0A915CM43_9BILA
MALDAKVGESLFHKWECDSPTNYNYLVHDCYGSSERKNVQILDSDGCEVDAHFLETPNYSRTKGVEAKGLGGYVFQEFSAFKFPGDDNILFQCKISLCDMNSSDSCKQAVPPNCASKSRNQTISTSALDRDGPKLRIKRLVQQTKPGFALTVRVETRTLNVIENEAIRPPTPVRYCDVRN